MYLPRVCGRISRSNIPVVDADGQVVRLRRSGLRPQVPFFKCFHLYRPVYSFYL